MTIADDSNSRRLTKKRFHVRFQNGDEAGPFGAADLKSLVESGNLEREDHVSVEGTNRWVKADQVQGLFDSDSPNALASSSTSDSKEEEKNEPSKTETILGCGLIAAIAAVVVLAGWMAFSWFTSSPESTVKEFMAAWESSSSSAVLELDSRTIQPVKRLLREFPVHTFDGDIYSLGDNSLTNRATGETISTQDFRVQPVIRFGSSYDQQRFKVSVAEDSGKVILVEPWR